MEVVSYTAISQMMVSVLLNLSSLENLSPRSGLFSALTYKLQFGLTHPTLHKMFALPFFAVGA